MSVLSIGSQLHAMWLVISFCKAVPQSQRCIAGILDMLAQKHFEILWDKYMFNTRSIPCNCSLKLTSSLFLFWLSGWASPTQRLKELPVQFEQQSLQGRSFLTCANWRFLDRLEVSLLGLQTLHPAESSDLAPSSNTFAYGTEHSLKRILAVKMSDTSNRSQINQNPCLGLAGAKNWW